MLDFGALPPEVNSTLMFAGPGPGSLVAAAVTWDELAAELTAAAAAYRSVVAGLTSGRWLGPSSLSMASAVGPYVAWTSGTAARAAEAASHARLAIEIYEAAFAMTVPPSAVYANRARLATLVATNFLGQNSVAIAATEAEYVEYWAQDAAAMYQYAANSVEASDVTPFASPPQVDNPAGLVSQNTSVAAATGESGATQATLAQVVTSVPTALQGLSNPAAATTGSSGLLSGLTGGLTGGLSDPSSTVGMVTNLSMIGLTPLFGLSSVLGIAQTMQSMAATAATEVGGAAEAAAAGAAEAAEAALGSSVLGSMGQAAALGSLSVPPAWTSVIPTAPLAGVGTALQNGGMGPLSQMPALMGGMPLRGATTGAAAGPRYGLVPTVMAQPPSAGYGSAVS
ncbi:hypothetical protein A5791_16095 [Mycobacterium sp. 852002-51163_SCH5372311]|uniref:PPE family protein n=1 Tax=Mycobacterium sp. 852002-51163_SCH5372311 TaxID=1834097 RepID=UPI0008007295|nr:PPE family protein [Mycobacterium sp. 852002-51163_SCH5372311]OBF90845.1 hypothetical protein A5791_16095 [Mycobacterium sp. 852002-51163_SCH5372311]